MTLKLEIGKKYRNRKGEVVEIVNYQPHPCYPFIGSSGKAYMENGRWSNMNMDQQDLIEEVIEEPVKKPLKWAKEAHAWIDGIEVEGVSSKYQTWHLASQSFNPITHPHYEWRIAVPQWRKDLAEKMKAGGVLEVKYSGRWDESILSVDQLLNPKVIMSNEELFRIRHEPKPDVVGYCEASYEDKIRFIGSATSRKCPGDNLKLIWDGETGNLKGAEVLHG